jgi:class 3 adenylate cyclase/tetratricopeptide (TPR) repeat protein
VLFADISGYTTQCARGDPEQMHLMLGRFYASMDAVCACYGGQVFDRVGDAVMAVFGAPVAHGNDPERALRAAIDMHDAAAGLSDCDGAPLVLHIGVACGEVAAAVIRGGSAPSYSITGNTVNLAARLQTLAAAGETLISDALYRSVALLVDVESAGPYNVKGFSSPIAAWKLLHLHVASPALSPFVGRRSELLQMTAAIDGTLFAGRGVAVLVRGNAGIGKSRFAAEVRACASEKGFDVPLEQVLDFGVARGQAAVPALLRTLMGIALSDGQSECRTALERVTDQGLVRKDEALFIASLLVVPFTPQEKAFYDAIDNSTRADRCATALAAVLVRAAKIRPILLTVEDIHWASPELLQQLLAIGQAAVQTTMILLMTSRVGDDPLNDKWRAALQGTPLLTLDLPPLRPTEANALVSEWVDAASDFAKLCVARADGNPLFLEQLLRAPHEYNAFSVPPTIQSLVLERMDRLSGPERAALQAASVLGKRFSANGLNAIDRSLVSEIDALLNADIIRRDGDEFQFAHALIQEAVYASILRSRKLALHYQIAQCIGHGEPVLRAEHLDRADDPEAAQAFLSAAQHEMQNFRVESATALARRGAALARDSAVRCELSLLYAELLRESGHSADSIIAYRSALNLPTDDAQRCHAWMGIAAGCRVTGDVTQAVAALWEAESIAQQLRLELECSQIHHMRGSVHYAQGDVLACEAEHLKALDHALRSGNAECEVRALSGLGDAQLERGRMSQALSSFHRCVTICSEKGWIAIEIPNRCMLGHCLRYAARLDDALRETRRAWSDAQQSGVVPAQVFALMTLATVLADAGLADENEQVCEQGISLARRAGARRFEASLLLSLAATRLSRGQRTESMEHAQHALALARESGLGFAGAATFGMIARAADNAGQRADALRQGEALLLQPCTGHSVLRFHVNAIEASVLASEWDNAARYAIALETFMRAEPLPWATLLVARARALIDLATGSDHGAALRRLQWLREEVFQINLGSALAAIDRALALHDTAINCDRREDSHARH